VAQAFFGQDIHPDDANLHKVLAFIYDQQNNTDEALKEYELALGLTPGDVIVRLFEAMRTATRCTLVSALPVKSAAQTNMVEELDAASADALRSAVQTVEEALRARGYLEVGHIVEFFGKSPMSHRSQAEVKVPAVPAV